MVILNIKPVLTSYFLMHFLIVMGHVGKGGKKVLAFYEVDSTGESIPVSRLIITFSNVVK